MLIDAFMFIKLSLRPARTAYILRSVKLHFPEVHRSSPFPDFLMTNNTKSPTLDMFIQSNQSLILNEGSSKRMEEETEGSILYAVFKMASFFIRAITNPREGNYYCRMRVRRNLTLTTKAKISPAKSLLLF
jgi:hypothetical protein